MPQESREIRVFISSTFADMREERKYLNTKVFPKLRKICQQRRVEFTEVDLQWGIDDADAKQGGAVEICLEEINHCQPYFIGILGERYGWSPGDDQLSVREDEREYSEDDEKQLILIGDEVLRERVRDWLTKDESVTAMEIIHGVLESNQQAKYSYFYFRNKAYTQELLKLADVQDEAFLEANDLKREKLLDLKTRIRSQEKPWHVREASTASTDDKGYTDIEQFGKQVYDDLLQVINKKFPKDETISSLDKERRFHAAFASSRFQSYIPDETAFAKVFERFKVSGSPLVISGEMGSGKSALLANFASRWKDENSNGLVIEHYAGSGGESDVLGVLGRVMSEIKDIYKVSESIPSNADDVYAKFVTWLSYVTADKPLLLVLDGVNQLHGDLKRFVYALPQQVDHVNILLSTLEGEVLDSVRERDWRVQSVAPLDQAQRSKLVKTYFEHYKKNLANLTNSLINSRLGHNPLFLRVVMDELRVDATHESLKKMLEGYLEAESLVELFEMVLDRCEKAYDKSNVPLIMSLIYASRYGLSEPELRAICDEKSDSNVAPLYISLLLFGLGGYLADREGLYGFMHDALREAVQKKFITKNTEQLARQKIVGYLTTEEVTHGVSQRQIDELPWQWKMLNKDGEYNKCLQEYLARIDVMEAFTNRTRWEEEVFVYWRAGACGPSIMLEKSMIHLQQGKVYQFDLLSVFYCFAGFYEQAATLCSKALAKAKAEFGNKHANVANSLNNLATVLSEDVNSDTVEASYDKAEVLYGESLAILKGLYGDKHLDIANTLSNLASVLGRQIGRLDDAEALSRDSLVMRKELLGDKHPSIATSLNNLAIVLFNQGSYPEAESLSCDSLVMRKELLGDKHPEVAISLNNLAVFLVHQRRFSEAETLFCESFVMSKELLGDQHPNLAATLHGWADALKSQYRFCGKAEILYREVLEVIDDNHLHIEAAQKSLRECLKVQGKLDKTKKLLDNQINWAEKLSFAKEYGNYEKAVHELIYAAEHGDQEARYILE